MYEFRLRFHWSFFPKCRINNVPTLVQTMTWRRPRDKPLSEPLMVQLLTHLCVTWLQWFNCQTFQFLLVLCLHKMCREINVLLLAILYTKLMYFDIDFLYSLNTFTKWKHLTLHNPSLSTYLDPYTCTSHGPKWDNKDKRIWIWIKFCLP